MSTAAELHSQIASIVEVLANSAVAEICKAVEDGYAVVNLEMSRSLKENECLRRRVRLLELQVTRYRAEQRLKAPPEGAASGRVFPGVRLLHHRSGRDTPTGSSLQSRSRFVNRAVAQKTPQTNLEQDPDQEVVTTTKAEPTESEEDSDLVIVKVEGSVSIDDTSAPPPASDAPSHAQREVSAPQTCSDTLDASNTTRPSSEVIVIDKEDAPGDRAPSPGLKSAWLSGTSNTAASFLNTSSQRFKTFNPGKNTFSVSASSTSNPCTAQAFNPGQNTSPFSVSASLSSNLGATQTFTPGQNTSPFSVSASSTSNPGMTKKFTSGQNPSPFSVSASLSSNPGTSQGFSSGQNTAPFSMSLSSNSGTTQTFTPGQNPSNPQTFAPRPPGVRLFPCSKCPMRFFLEAELVKHAASHRNRKYVCGLCGKAFICKSQLEIHQNVHTGQKPFTCSVCQSSFSHPSNLRRHMKLQHQQHLKT